MRISGTTLIVLYFFLSRFNMVLFPIIAIKSIWNFEMNSCPDNSAFLHGNVYIYISNTVSGNIFECSCRKYFFTHHKYIAVLIMMVWRFLRQCLMAGLSDILTGVFAFPALWRWHFSRILPLKLTDDSVNRFGTKLVCLLYLVLTHSPMVNYSEASTFNEPFCL